MPSSHFDSPSQAGPSRIPQDSPEGSPIEGLFPGFLSPGPDDPLDSPPLRHRRSLSPLSPDSGLPYLRGGSESPGPGASLRDEDDSPIASGAPGAGGRSPPGSGSSGTAMPPLSASSFASDRGPMSRKRPTPLSLSRSAQAVGVDEELASARESEGLQTGAAMSSEGGARTLSHELGDLRFPRNTQDRPLHSPLSGLRGPSSNDRPPSFPALGPSSAGLSLPDHATVSLAGVLALLQSPAQALIVDTRPLGAFLAAHLPRSANISIPTLIFKRYRKAIGAKPTWSSLAGFISTPAGATVWNSIDHEREVEVVIVGTTPIDEMARVLREVMDGVIRMGRVRVLQGGWAAVEDSLQAREVMVGGESSLPTTAPMPVGQDMTSLSPPRGAPPPPPIAGPSSYPPPPPIPPSDPSTSARLAPRISLPSLKASSIAEKRSVPSLSVSTAHPLRGPPKLSLNLDKPSRSATLSAFPSSLQSKSPGLKINTAAANRLKHGMQPGDIPQVSVTAPKSPAPPPSLQVLCHAQSKLPPSPSTFAEITTSFAPPPSPLGTTSTSAGAGSSGRFPTPQFASRPRPARAGASAEEEEGPRTLVPGSSRTSVAPFIVSTILPNFLYLGPEITSDEEVETLLRTGIKRILNVAIECDDDAGLRIKERFERYLKLPMRDIVEETGMAKGMRDSCDFLDDARLHSAPTYVHCKAGKSRSVTVVLAYLIHANAWTLKTSYAYVAERRKGISPNIGFVAELMQFEESELGLKQSSGVHGESSLPGGTDSGGGGSEKKEKRANPRQGRESLPPAWAAPAARLDGPPPAPGMAGGDDGGRSTQSGPHESPDAQRRQAGGEKEVRKNGQWVHQRRAPVDRTTLQPGRRVSKAGLESLRPLAPAGTSTSTSQDVSPIPSPVASESAKHDTSTPSGEGRLGWI